MLPTPTWLLLQLRAPSSGLPPPAALAGLQAPAPGSCRCGSPGSGVLHPHLATPATAPGTELPPLAARAQGFSSSSPHQPGLRATTPLQLKQPNSGLLPLQPELGAAWARGFCPPATAQGSLGSRLQPCSCGLGLLPPGLLMGLGVIQLGLPP